jgi:hypothetical protein
MQDSFLSTDVRALHAHKPTTTESVVWSFTEEDSVQWILFGLLQSLQCYISAKKLYKWKHFSVYIYSRKPPFYCKYFHLDLEKFHHPSLCELEVVMVSYYMWKIFPVCFVQNFIYHDMLEVVKSNKVHVFQRYLRLEISINVVCV